MSLNISNKKRVKLFVSSVFILSSIFFAVLFLTKSVQAQTTPDFTNSDPTQSTNPDDLSLPEKYPQIQEQVDTNVTPENPKPGDTVTITVATYGIDLNILPISWTVNGVEKLHGIGQKKFSFTLGNSGSVTNISVTITPRGSTPIVRSFSFAPIDVDILWQANTYTPPFYKGKALYTPESNVTFVAMPNIITSAGRVNPTDVVYKWKENYEVQGDKSGFGKNTYSFDGPIILDPVNIGSEVYAASNPSIDGYNSFTLNNSYPLAVVYENNPIYGVMFNKAVVGEYNLKGKEVKFSTFPYFFSTDNKNTDVSYGWNLNDGPLDIPSYENSTVFRRTDNTAGQAKVDVGIGEDSKMLQSAGNEFIIKYDTLSQ